MCSAFWNCVSWEMSFQNQIIQRVLGSFCVDVFFSFLNDWIIIIFVKKETNKNTCDAWWDWGGWEADVQCCDSERGDDWLNVGLRSAAEDCG